MGRTDGLLWLMGSTWSAGMARCSAQRSDPGALELHTRVLARGAARVSLGVLAKNTARRCFHCRPCQDGAHCRRVPPHLSHSLPHGCRPSRAPARIPERLFPKRPPQQTRSLRRRRPSPAPDARPASPASQRCAACHQAARRGSLDALLPVKQSFAYQRCEDAADAADAHPARDLRVLVPAGRTAGGGQDGGPARRASAGRARECAARGGRGAAGASFGM